MTVALIAALGRAVWGERVGLLAGGLGAVFLPLAALDTTLLSESLFLPVQLGVALALARLRRRPGSARAALAGSLVGLAALTRATADLWLLAVLALVASARLPAAARMRAAAACVAAAVLVVAPWTIRNAVVFQHFVPISTESGYMLAGQYNEMADRGGALLAVWHLPTTQAPDVERAVAPLVLRPRGANEVQLDGALRHVALSYLRRHPLHILLAVGLGALRLFGLGPGHTFTSAESYRELNIPLWLRLPTTLSAWGVTLLALGAVVLARRRAAGGWIGRRAAGGSIGRRAAGAIARRRRGGRHSPPLQPGTGLAGAGLGPWWLWALPLLNLLVTLPLTGTLRKRLPLDPYLVLLAAVACETLMELWRARRRAAATPSVELVLAAPGRAPG